MREILLTQGKVAFVDDADYGKVSSFKWYAHRIGNGFYASSKSFGRASLMHRVVVGVSDPKILVDHRDRNGLNNFRSNLRVTDKHGNQGNARKARHGRTSKFRGVSWDSGRQKYLAQIEKYHQMCYLGRFDSEVDAAKAYDEAARLHFGEFANLNFPYAAAA